ncbi:MAG: hypothetical protein LBP85_02220 [Prevotellaceae bacterium]|jgi:hypothetical protein|nr:hypothetical protein [Prevotellaceae bacterium]
MKALKSLAQGKALQTGNTLANQAPTGRKHCSLFIFYLLFVFANCKAGSNRSEAELNGVNPDIDYCLFAVLYSLFFLVCILKPSQFAMTFCFRNYAPRNDALISV